MENKITVLEKQFSSSLAEKETLGESGNEDSTRTQIELLRRKRARLSVRSREHGSDQGAAESLGEADFGAGRRARALAGERRIARAGDRQRGRKRVHRRRVRGLLRSLHLPLQTAGTFTHALHTLLTENSESQFTPVS